MDKRKNKILVGCLSLLLVMAVGYALFSENITINGTATAKGDFAYEIATYKGVSEEINTDNLKTINVANRGKFGALGTDVYPSYSAISGVEDSFISNTKNNITFTTNFDYPEQTQYYTAKITNTGSIPITFDFWKENEEGEKLNSTFLTGNLLMDDGGKVNVENVMKYVSGEIAENPYNVDGTTNGFLSIIRAQLTNYKVLIPTTSHDEFVLNYKTAYPKINTGESVYFIFSSYLQSWECNDSMTSDVIGYDLTATTSITLPISQYIPE